MAPQVDLPDPSDWLATTLASFAPIDAALRCQVCKDFFTTPMLTSCSHTFCSLCIRRCLGADGACPTCRKSDQESKLRHNKTVDELVVAFQAARPAALELARKDVADGEGGSGQRLRRGAKRKLEDAEFEAEDAGRTGAEPRSRRQSKRLAGTPVPGTSEVIHIDDDGDAAADDDDDDDGDYEVNDGLVPCPICNKRMKEEAVYSHLDKCTGQDATPSHRAEPNSRASIRGPTVTLKRQQSSPKPPSNQTPARIPQLNYSLLKDRALRQKLTDLGIPDWGPRQLLIRRHTEWANLYNANCDSARPRTKRELLRDLDVWERTQGGNPPAEGPTIMRREFDGEKWARDNRDEFKELIARARKPPSKATAPKSGQEPNGTEGGGEGQNQTVEAASADEPQLTHSSEEQGQTHALPPDSEPVTGHRREELMKTTTSTPGKISERNSIDFASPLIGSAAEKVPTFQLPADSTAESR